MNKIKENLLLHPVRLRILLAAAGREVTAQQLAMELPDIPQAALMPYLKNEPSPERRRSILGLISLPDAAGAPSRADAQTGIQDAEWC